MDGCCKFCSGNSFFVKAIDYGIIYTKIVKEEISGEIKDFMGRYK